MLIELNGREREIEDASTVADVVAAETSQTRGVAVAVGGEVVPRSAWVDTRIEAGDAVEILQAVQGG